MARLHTNILHWGNKYDGPNTYKQGREGALDDAFWDEDELVDYRKYGKKKDRFKKKRGCPDNDYKAHVYVWVKETRYHGKWSAFIGWVPDKTRPYTIDTKVCCGCGKVDHRRYNW